MFRDFGIDTSSCTDRRSKRSTSFGALIFLICWAFAFTASCQRPNNTALTGEEYPHPGIPSTGGVSTAPAAIVKSAAKDISSTAETILTVSNTTIKIPAGTILEPAMASLSSYGGTFINTPSVVLESEPVLLVITGADGQDLPRNKIHKDILVEVVSGKRAVPTKLTMLFHEGGGLASAEKTGIAQSVLSPMLSLVSGSTYKASFQMRPARVAIVMAQTPAGTLPLGFEVFKQPSIEVTELVGVANSPADVTLTWKSDSSRNQGFAMVYAKASEVTAVCTLDDLIEPDYDEATAVYSHSVAGLDDNSEYTFKVCSSSFRDPVDLSAGASVSVTTPKRAVAVLSNTPNSPTNVAALNVSVGGENLTFYRYSLLSGVSNCSTAVYSSWIAASTPITNTLTGDGAKLLCVLGRIDPSNDQLVPTTHAFTLDQTPPSFTSAALINDVSPSSQSAINLAEKNNTTALVGTPVASGYDSIAYSVSQASSCSSALTYTPSVPTNQAVFNGPEASNWRVCIKLSDIAGNTIYRQTTPVATFIVDWTPPTFTSLPFANAALGDGYINNTEQTSSPAAVVGAATPTGASNYSTSNFAIVPSTTICDATVNYSLSVAPGANNSGFSSNGLYKVCVRLRDAAFNATYGGSNIITVKKSLPTFTSIQSGDDVVDGFLSASERLSANPLAKDLIGSNYDTSQYALVTSTTACNSVLPSAYGSMPLTNDPSLNIQNQSYKVCVKLSDVAANPAAYGETASFTALLESPTCASVPLANDAIDGVINSMEHLTTNDLTAGVDSASASVVATRFSIISNSALCDGSQVFSSAIPASNNSAFSVSGSYKICAQVADSSSQFGYCESSAIDAFTDVITFASIDRVGPAADGYINSAERLVAEALVGNLVGAHFDTAQYALVTSATTCDANVTYAALVPMSDSPDLATDGESYKVCVELSDHVGNPKAYGSSATLTLDLTAPTFSSVSFTGVLLDHYLNAEEHSLSSDILGAVSGSGYSLEQFSVVSSTTTCGVPLTWSTSKPKANHSSFTLDGSYKVCVQITDDAGNLAHGESDILIFDDTLPVFTSIDLANDALDTYVNLAESGSALAVVNSLSASGHVSEQYLAVANSADCSSQAGYSTGIPTSSDFSGLNGSFKICVEIADIAGNKSYGSSNTIHVDTTPPGFTSLGLGASVADGYLSLSEHALSSALGGSLVASGQDLAQYAVVTNVTTCDGSLTFGVMPLANDASVGIHEESFKLCVKLTDLAGNPAAYGASNSFTALLTAPSCTDVPWINAATDGYINGAEHTSGLVLTSGVSGATSTASSTHYAVISSSATCNASHTFSGSLPKAEDAIFGVNGTYKLCAKVADAASQAGYCESSAITVVNNTMTFTSIDLSGPAIDGYINTTEHASSTAIVANLVGTYYDTAAYAVVTAATPCNASVTYGSVVPAAHSGDISSDGASYKVCVELSDAAGNPKAYGASSSFTYDNTAPAFISLPLANAAGDGYINSDEHALTSEVVGLISASGQSSVQYALVTNTTTCGFPLTWVTNPPKANDVLFVSTASYKVCAQLTDLAGNATYGSSSDIFFDDVAPLFTSIALANTASNAYINAAESSSGLVVVDSLSASGQSSVNYKVVLNSVTCSTVSSYSASVPTGADFNGLNGDYKVCVELVDPAGNKTYGSSSAIEVDTTPPSFTSVSLVGDALDGSINGADLSAASALVSAAIGSGYDSIHYTLVTSVTSCSSASGWSLAIPQSNHSAFTVVDSYKVCVRLSDIAGNPDAFGASATFLFDNVSPGFSSLTLSGDASDGLLSQSERSNVTSIIGTLTASDYTSASYKMVASATGCDASLTYGLSINSNSSDITVDGSYKVCVRLVDAAGNVTYGASSSVVVDTEFPVFSSLALGAAVADGYLSLSEKNAATSLGGSLVSSGGGVYAYAAVLSTATCDAAVSYGGMPNSNHASLVTANSYKLCARVADSAGNAVYGSSASFSTDFIAPSISGITLSTSISDGYLNIADQLSGANLVTATSASNHDSLEYSVASAATTCDSSLTYNASIPKTDSPALSADGSWKVCLKASDIAGNAPSYAASSSFARDLMRPTSAVSTTGTIDATTTVGSTTVINGTASDATSGLSSGVVSIQEGAGSCFDPAASDFTAACPNWLSVSGTGSWSYTLDDNDLIKGQTYTVTIKATDNAGNEQISFGSGTFSFTATESSSLWSADLKYDRASGDDRALAGAVDSGGNLYVVGYHTFGDKNWLIKKFSRRGVEDIINWNKDVGDAGVDEIARGVAVDASDNVYVVGSRHNGTDYDWMIKKYSSSGIEDQTYWDMLINSGNGHDEALGVTTDASGNVYVAGYGRNIAGASSGEDVWIKKFQSNGTLLCEQKLDEGSASLADRATSIAINNTSSKIYITGYKTAVGPDQRLFVKRLRMSDCSIEASATGSSSGSADYGASIKVDSAGAVYVAGVYSAFDQDWWIQKYSAALALSTEINANVNRSHGALALGIDSNNRIYVGGYKTMSAAPNSQDTWLRQFNSSLAENMTWNKTFDGASGHDQVTAIVVTSGAIDADNVYMIGWSTNLVGGSSSMDWWIKKLAGP